MLFLVCYLYVRIASCKLLNKPVLELFVHALSSLVLNSASRFFSAFRASKLAFVMLVFIGIDSALTAVGAV